MYSQICFGDHKPIHDYVAYTLIINSVNVIAFGNVVLLILIVSVFYLCEL